MIIAIILCKHNWEFSRCLFQWADFSSPRETQLVAQKLNLLDEKGSSSCLAFRQPEPKFSHWTPNPWKLKAKWECLCLLEKLNPYSFQDPPGESYFSPDQTPDTRFCPSLVRPKLRVVHPSFGVYLDDWESLWFQKIWIFWNFCL